MTELIRYKTLPNFPQEIIDVVREFFYKHYPDRASMDHIANPEEHKKSNLRYDGKEIEIPGCPEIKFVHFLMVAPESGRMRVHFDIMRDFCINVPIQVNQEKGPFFTVKPECMDRILETAVGPHKNGYDFIPECFDFITVTSPMLVNTAIPHGASNEHNEWRVMMSMDIELDTIEDAWEYCKRKNWT